MVLRRFQYRAATSPEEAVLALAAAGGKGAVIAGGSDLLGTLKDNIHAAYPELLIDIKPMAGFDRITADGTGVTIGALTTLGAVANDKLVRERYPLLAQAARSVASPQVRNRATVGGNLCQEPRCWYYRHPEDRFHCLRKGGKRCAALLGDHRFHSIFGAVRTTTPACAATCPGHVEIPRYLESVRRGDLAQAAAILLDRNPMPAITGRVCPHTCEHECNRTDLDEALSIRAVERHVGDYVLAHAETLMSPPASDRAEHVAIVGAGPAGLAAAYYLRRAGYAVTVFEQMPEAGGMLTYGIPAFRLPKWVVRSQIRAFERLGIEFRTGVAVSRSHKGLTLAALRKQYQAVFLATGAWQAKALSLPGAELMQSGLDLLIGVQCARSAAVGRQVLVIGGGNVALDVAMTARRLGAGEVTVACLESRDTMPAFPQDLEQALREGIRLLPSWGPKSVVAANGVIHGVELVRCTSVLDARGGFHPTFDPAVTQAVAADQVLVAIGQVGDLRYVTRSGMTAAGLIVADPETGRTRQAGVFAGGDATTSRASVIEAIAAGRRAALAMAADLRGMASSTPAATRGDVRPCMVAVNTQACGRTARVCVPETPLAERTLQAEDVPTLGLSAVQQEACRCIDCACVAVNSSDLATAFVALGATIRTTRRRLTAQEFFEAGPLRTTVLAKDELVLAVELPGPRPTAAQSYLKFRLRQSIDFPIASVAGVIGLEAGRISEARVVFGAVAPVPLRADAVETFLIGKTLSEETAYAAGEIAAQGACVLTANRYKVQILKALLRKLILTGECQPPGVTGHCSLGSG